MLSVSDLSLEQIEKIKSWVAEGAQMADVQRGLTDEFGLKVTYMDTRFLSLDLDLEFQIEEAPAEPKVEGELAEVPESEATVPSPVDSPLIDAPNTASVVATLDQVARPGAMVSGTVTFSDGMKGRWMIDELGRPSVDPDQAGYQPSEADLVAFQGELRTLLDGQM